MQQLFARKMLAALICLTSLIDLSAQVTYTQGFENTAFPPIGWTLATTTGNNLWARRTTGTSPTCTPHSGAAMARFDSHAATAGRTQALITPVIDYSDLAGHTATFSLWVYRDTGVLAAEDSLTISINTTANDTGSIYIGSIARNIAISLPDTQSASGWYPYTFNIPSSFNTNTNYIIINGTSQFGNNIFVDDIEWIAYPTQCSGAPSAGTIKTGEGIICGGSGSTTLGLTGATNGYSGLTYQWLSATSATGPWAYFDSVPTTTTGTIAVTTYYRCVITCTFSGLTDTTSVATVVVSTQVAPVVTITPPGATYCPGGAPVTLTAAGALTYSWSPSTGLNNTLDSAVLASPTITTRYTVTGTSLNGCSSTAQASVNVRTAPVLTITALPDTVCAGDSTKLSVTTSGFVTGATYTWSVDSLTGANITIAPASTTLYWVTMTSQNGCPATDSMWVYASPVSTAAFGYTPNGHTITFQDSSLNATSWLWLFGDGNTSANQNPVYTYSADGQDTVRLITSGLCPTADTLVKIITVYATGIISLSTDANILVYPNPAQNYAIAEFNLNESVAQVTVLNALGQTVAYYNVVPAKVNTCKQQIDMSKMAVGVYVIRVTTATQNITQQIVKQ